MCGRITAIRSGVEMARITRLQHARGSGGTAWRGGRGGNRSSNRSNRRNNATSSSSRGRNATAPSSSLSGNSHTNDPSLSSSRISHADVSSLNHNSPSSSRSRKECDINLHESMFGFSDDDVDNQEENCDIDDVIDSANKQSTTISSQSTGGIELLKPGYNIAPSSVVTIIRPSKSPYRLPRVPFDNTIPNDITATAHPNDIRVSTTMMGENDTTVIGQNPTTMGSPTQMMDGGNGIEISSSNNNISLQHRSTSHLLLDSASWGLNPAKPNSWDMYKANVDLYQSQPGHKPAKKVKFMHNIRSDNPRLITNDYLTPCVIVLDAFIEWKDPLLTVNEPPQTFQGMGFLDHHCDIETNPTIISLLSTLNPSTIINPYLQPKENTNLNTSTHGGINVLNVLDKSDILPTNGVCKDIAMIHHQSTIGHYDSREMEHRGLIDMTKIDHGVLYKSHLLSNLKVRNQIPHPLPPSISLDQRNDLYHVLAKAQHPAKALDSELVSTKRVKQPYAIYSSALLCQQCGLRQELEGIPKARDWPYCECEYEPLRQRDSDMLGRFDIQKDKQNSQEQQSEKIHIDPQQDIIPITPPKPNQQEQLSSIQSNPTAQSHILNHDALYCAGVYNVHSDPETGLTKTTCAIITMESNQQMGFLHDRMPFILSPFQIEEWLSYPIEKTNVLVANAAADLNPSNGLDGKMITATTSAKTTTTPTAKTETITSPSSFQSASKILSSSPPTPPLTPLQYHKVMFFNKYIQPFVADEVQLPTSDKKTTPSQTLKVFYSIHPRFAPINWYPIGSLIGKVRSGELVDDERVLYHVKMFQEVNKAKNLGKFFQSHPSSLTSSTNQVGCVGNSDVNVAADDDDVVEDKLHHHTLDSARIEKVLGHKPHNKKNTRHTTTTTNIIAFTSSHHNNTVLIDNSDDALNDDLVVLQHQTHNISPQKRKLISSSTPSKQSLSLQEKANQLFGKHGNTKGGNKSSGEPIILLSQGDQCGGNTDHNKANNDEGVIVQDDDCCVSTDITIRSPIKRHVHTTFLTKPSIDINSERVKKDEIDTSTNNRDEDFTIIQNLPIVQLNEDGDDHSNDELLVSYYAYHPPVLATDSVKSTLKRHKGNHIMSSFNGPSNKNNNHKAPNNNIPQDLTLEEHGTFIKTNKDDGDDIVVLSTEVGVEGENNGLLFSPSRSATQSSHPSLLSTRMNNNNNNNNHHYYHPPPSTKNDELQITKMSFTQPITPTKPTMLKNKSSVKTSMNGKSFSSNTNASILGGQFPGWTKMETIDNQQLSGDVLE